jgi:carbamoyltransferase
MYVLGLNAFTHDASAALLCDGKILGYAQEERFTRIKHDPSFPWNSIEYCLKEAGISLDNVAIAAFSWAPYEKIIPRLIKTFYNLTGGISRLQGQSSKWFSILRVPSELRKRGFQGKFYFVKHHDAHAAACYYASGFERSAILVIDGVGEHATTSFYEAADNSITLLKQFYYPDSLGLFYASITEYLGYGHNEGEGKVMGMAAYGKPVFAEAMHTLLFIKSKEYQINTQYFDFAHDWVTESFIKEFGPRRDPDEPLDQRHYDIAASAQAILEEQIIALCTTLKKATHLDNICYTGGVSLNCQANWFIQQHHDFQRYYFFPVAYDAGTSLGAGLWVYRNMLGHSEELGFEHVFWGPDLNKAACAAAAQKHKLKIIDSATMHSDIATALSRGKIIGWAEGRIEVGPRALGNRCIIADPRKPENKDLVNNKIKKREPFRPFAPAILAEKTEAYFGKQLDSPYMMLTVPILESKKNEVPAIVHADGTCRVQTLKKEFNSDFYALIEAFYQLTNVPILLNTSFNKAGEPIVSSGEDALASFVNSELDILVLAGLIIMKQ